MQAKPTFYLQSLYLASMVLTCAATNLHAKCSDKKNVIATSLQNVTEAYLLSAEHVLASRCKCMQQWNRSQRPFQVSNSCIEIVAFSCVVAEASPLGACALLAKRGFVETDTATADLSTKSPGHSRCAVITFLLATITRLLEGPLARSQAVHREVFAFHLAGGTPH